MQPDAAASDLLTARGLSLRPQTDSDQPFLQQLFDSFRAEEMALMPWPPEQKAAFLNQQFRLQHHHFVTYFHGADFWIVGRVLESGAATPVGRFYLDRSTPMWHVIDIGFVPEARGQGQGSALLKWAQAAASDAGAEGIGLHVVTTNARAAALYRRLGFQAAGDAEGFHQAMAWRARDSRL